MTDARVLPGRPRLVLRVGFAGTQDDVDPKIATRILEVLDTVGRYLAKILPGSPVAVEGEPPVATHYARTCPLLRLVTGLCEGADEAAAAALSRVRVTAGASDRSQSPPCLETELAAVLPFDFESYRDSRPAGYRTTLDQRAASCAYVLTLDGRFDQPNPDTAAAKSRRARGYRAQSAMLLRHSDLLVAVTDPDNASKAGGTLETVERALRFDLPVVLVHSGTGEVYLIERGGHLHATLSSGPLNATDCHARLEGWVTRIVADPDVARTGHGDPATARHHGEALMSEFFGDKDTPPLDGEGNRGATWRERVWTWLEDRLKTGHGPKADPVVQEYAGWRRRASDLNRHYSGLYRGAFLLNYVLAIVAVALAAGSLALIATIPQVEAWELSSWLPLLLVLGLIKLAIVIFISKNTHRANRDEWNSRAVDYRYVAERLRALYYLPLVGSYQPPAASPPQYASRVVRQSTVDWLCDAITRAVSPADLDVAGMEEFPSAAGTGSIQVRIIRPDPLAALRSIRDSWIGGQTIYHARNARTMGLLDRVAEKAGRWMGWFVIGIVAVDIACVISELVHWPPSWGPTIEVLTPWLVFLTAMLPAAIAALNGIRFQSECRRLEERSAVMRVILGGRPPEKTSKRSIWLVRFCKGLVLVVRHLVKKPPPVPGPKFTGGHWKEAGKLVERIDAAISDPATDPGAWSLDVLYFVETIADAFVQEVGEWSVLYAKELPDPG